MRRFAVDDVVPAKDRLPTRPIAARYPEALAIGGDGTRPVIDHGAAHPLLAAVGIAFAQHRPLVLSPDAVWLTIAQGVAHHIRLHAEQLRSRLVRHQGKKSLTITTSATPRAASGWAEAVTAFRDLLAQEIGDGPIRLFECDFSTSTEVERLASQIVMLDAYSPYFSLWMVAVCGIPEITLLGTVDDWRRIRERIDVIAELELGFWSQSLVPIADQFVAAATGDVDVSFWRRIYNPADAYGGDIITGWITRLYPYVKGNGAFDVRNPMLELPIGEPKNHTTESDRTYRGRGIRSDSVPATMSRAIVRIVDQSAGAQSAVALVGGVAGVAQDADGGLRPIVGWHLEKATAQMADVIARIISEHQVTYPTAGVRRHLQGPREVVELFSQIESGTLFEGARAWRLRRPREHHWVSFERGGRFQIRRIADLPDGRSLCAATRRFADEAHWLLCRLEDPAPDPTLPEGIEVIPGSATPLDLPADIPILGTSLSAILDAAFTTGGDIAHLEVGRFDSLLRI